MLDEYVQSGIDRQKNSGIDRHTNANASSLKRMALDFTNSKNMKTSNGIYTPGFNQNPYPYGYPMPIQQAVPPLASEDVNLRLSLEKQNMLLKNLSKQIDNNSSSLTKRDESRSKLDSRDYNRKIREIEKDNEIKMALMKQQQQIELLTNIKSKEQEPKASPFMDPSGIETLSWFNYYKSSIL